MRRWVHNHILLLLIKEQPDLDDTLEVVFAHFVEVRLGTFQLLLPLLFENFQIKAQESSDTRRVFQLQVLHISMDSVN